MRFAALGRTGDLYESIRELVRRGHECVWIGTAPAAPEYDVGEADFEALARELGCDFFCDVRINRPALWERARRSRASVAISVNWPGLIGESMLAAFEHGVLNAHSGDLPRYRGNAVQNWALLAGEPVIVLCIHRMSPDLDAGDVLARARLPVGPDTYIADVYAWEREQVPRLFAGVVDDLAASRARAEPQDESRALRCHPRLPRDSQIDWSRTADEIARLVRAVSEPFGGAYTWLEGERLVVWRARAEPAETAFVAVPGQVAARRPETGEVVVCTREGLLVLEQIEVGAGGRERPADRIRSLRARLGLDPADEIHALRGQISELARRLEAAEEILARLRRQRD